MNSGEHFMNSNANMKMLKCKNRLKIRKVQKIKLSTVFKHSYKTKKNTLSKWKKTKTKSKMS